ncbi:GPW/gp25 family protein [Erwinia tracheiphila]|uniref:Baseplate assembly protein n=1 Tax=Erwinia tracheiphila TaxID=65700 RepID=A0A0M2KFW3_9GAMM|nr:GPW/gp25 family protein [Erwinia tracheiphila]AXF77453.1 baseplate assembly protein [Erwinia tracheiphila]EOS92600.1 GPW/gp25 family protein [Erwinia tracheiphila PSU-1]KKF34441.1 baseplate assembly protein [Erwinia tracheiphila]KKF35836.1 baseplate assembly protein [Erwinia tracheiphila]UIA83850.1 GPW/gp25 family protein [Erwinia tracheiphila]
MTVRYTGMNPDGTGLLTDSDQLWNSVRDILTTPLASRVMRRDYGSLIPDLLDAPQNEVTRLQCMSAAAIALTQWEPRIALSGISINYSKDGAVTAELTGIITETMQAAGGVLTLRSGSNGNG